MTGAEPRPTLALVCGLPGAGKTTWARQLAEAYRAVRLSPDEWMVGLRVDRHDERFRARLELQLTRHTRELLGAGASVVLEFGFWSRIERDALHASARRLGARIELHVLEVDLDERWRRIDARNRTGPDVIITREQLQSWDRLWQSPTAAEHARYDPPHYPHPL